VLLAFSAFNLGILGIYVGIPFLVIAAILANSFKKKKLIYIFLFIESLLVVAMGHILVSQPLLFPILRGDGYAEVISDAYCYRDSTGFNMCYTDQKAVESLMNTMSSGDFPSGGGIIKVKTGEKYKIASIVLMQDDFTSKVYLKTEQGFELFPENYESIYSASLGNKQIFKLNKPVVSNFLAIINTPFTAVIPTIEILERH
jgi:hypothetical protein